MVPVSVTTTTREFSIFIIAATGALMMLQRAEASPDGTGTILTGCVVRAWWRRAKTALAPKM
jgi:hypothetical protein